eukprot:CAMPEP_0201521742 /NCGR_PEP_ID=MMETSP0161_2-20130828/15991_1 /ASSEMBLY_ACC=CAM_ASM_000251 /TAXON_ID=180227 /ORGANISM="Neoparamoeba aestuarina, Strain SoJaBio B1-5/56/2" /LENGTH=213 /DNA_ID=CAMNT_0047920439 /DNA_START=85 /DNA_END=726 /DNA_ORIENTATION=+
MALINPGMNPGMQSGMLQPQMSQGMMNPGMQPAMQPGMSGMIDPGMGMVQPGMQPGGMQPEPPVMTMREILLEQLEMLKEGSEEGSITEEEYEEQRVRIINALTGTDWDGKEKHAGRIDMYNDYRSANKLNGVLSPFDGLPKEGGLITKRDVGKQVVDKRVGWGMDGNGNWQFFVPRAADGSPLLDEKELKDRLASGNRQYGFAGRSNIVRMF